MDTQPVIANQNLVLLCYFTLCGVNYVPTPVFIPHSPLCRLKSCEMTHANAKTDNQTDAQHSHKTHVV